MTGEKKTIHITSEDVKGMIERVKKRMREEEAERKRLGLRRPEESGLTERSRHFTFNY